jgi:hypothetical protein
MQRKTALEITDSEDLFTIPSLEIKEPCINPYPHNRGRHPDCRAGRHMSLGASKSKIDTITYTKTNSTHLDIAAASQATSLVSDARRTLALQAARYHAAALSIRARSGSIFWMGGLLAVPARHSSLFLNKSSQEK